ncbi:MAG: DUF1015 domain-containing protein [Flavobacteriales bacterium]|nr:DUF1015 domain-containing protein [Flavobacteriales bacterium]MBK7555361.1 DUF1015 domain-containing protein [Flavobacteriales bacterium]MBK9195895.1 DUF1015 domain-containing protein [Flavobacteriales bacterium]MBP6573477.1 DUF1015 domain-containing protein [Flavobacteriales bacterium]
MKIRPFRAWRPAPDKAHLVASRSYVEYAPDDLTAKLRSNPYSFLHIVHPDLGRDMHLTQAERFRRVRKKFESFCKEKILQQDALPSLYIYQQDQEDRSSRGIICAVSVQEYRDGLIKVHEQTLTARETLFEKYLGETGINAEPVLLTSSDMPLLEATMDRVALTRPELDLSTTDRVRHRLWAINDTAHLEEVEACFNALDALYIADGHHRTASSARLAESSNAKNEDPKAWCLAFIVPRAHLHIWNFDRAVTSLNGMDTAEFLGELGKVGALHPINGAPSTSPDQGQVFICTRIGWYSLQLPPPPVWSKPADGLDPALLSTCILAPVLGIKDLRTDPHIRFVPGTQGTAELERMVKMGEAAVAFHLRPISFEELKAVADSNGTMPPKSTYIEPKMRSGLTIYPLDRSADEEM